MAVALSLAGDSLSPLALRFLLASMYSVGFIFVNLGRSTNLRAWLGKGFERSREKLSDMEAVHLIHKTGWPRLRRTWPNCKPK